MMMHFSYISIRTNNIKWYSSLTESFVICTSKTPNTTEAHRKLHLQRSNWKCNTKRKRHHERIEEQTDPSNILRKQQESDKLEHEKLKKRKLFDKFFEEEDEEVYEEEAEEQEEQEEEEEKEEEKQPENIEKDKSVTSKEQLQNKQYYDLSLIHI